jgi:hypothetical protein
MKIRCLFDSARNTSGQAMILTALLMFVTIPLAAAVIDVGILLSNRRDAQNDADRSALAAVMELRLEPGNTDSWAAAEAIARQWLTNNGVNPDTEASILPASADLCFPGGRGNELFDGVPIGVTVTVQRDVPSFLAGVLGVDLRSAATATACGGRPVEFFGILPLVVAREGAYGTCFQPGTGIPIYGQLCAIRVGEPGAGALVGALSVDHDGGECTQGGSGANELSQNIVTGVQAWCGVGMIVESKTGQTVNQTYWGIRQRIMNQNACESYYATSGGTALSLAEAWGALMAYEVGTLPGIVPSVSDQVDDLFEIWQYNPNGGHPAQGLEPYPCESGRNGVLVVVDHLDQGISGNRYLIEDFGRIYIEGCTRQSGEVSKTCDFGQNLSGGGGFTIHARFVGQMGTSTSNLGLNVHFGDTEFFLKR